jgi:uncharacterized protein YndB with AHSA1/START domain
VFEIQETVAIDKPIEEVWEFVMEVENEPLWQTTLDAAMRLGSGPLRVGSLVRETRRFLGRRIDTTWEMIECDALVRSSIRSVDAPFAWSGTYALVEDGVGTRFTLTLQGDPGSFFRLAEPVFARIARREIAGNLANLKDVLEAGIAPEPKGGTAAATAG